MANGGSDCCGKCLFNRAVRARSAEWRFDAPRERVENFCLLRNVPIRSPAWTYCRNFTYGSRKTPAIEEVEVIGPILASGLYEGYTRIPWNGANEPRIYMPCVCAICGRENERGVEIDDDGTTLGFCSNDHYVQWWYARHPETHSRFGPFRSPDQPER